MINKNFFCVYDFETDSKFANVANPVQLAAKMYSPRTLEPVENSEFNMFCRPPGIDEDTYFDEHADTIKWHAELKGLTPMEILQLWKTYPAVSLVLKNFHAYTKKYISNKTEWGRPIRVGYNNFNFDDIIINRISQENKMVDKNGRCICFHPRDAVDVMTEAFLWFSHMEEPQKLSLDYLRQYFGISAVNAHDGLKDVQDTGAIFQRFSKLRKKIAAQVNFEGAFK